MRILVHFEARDREQVARDLEQVVLEILGGNRFGDGWCLSSECVCPVYGVTHPESPCGGDFELCRRLHLAKPSAP